MRDDRKFHFLLLLRLFIPLFFSLSVMKNAVCHRAERRGSGRSLPLIQGGKRDKKTETEKDSKVTLFLTQVTKSFPEGHKNKLLNGTKIRNEAKK